ncbi:MAG: hypothetical protein ACRC0V_05175 [Fusobacteriaceae bacterium]
MEDLNKIVFKGEIANIPTRIIRKMIENQILQGNKPSYEIFEKAISANRYDGGFDWYSSTEKKDFWVEVLMRNDVNLFDEKYPVQNN